jgi:hypothetical protein
VESLAVITVAPKEDHNNLLEEDNHKVPVKVVNLVREEIFAKAENLVAINMVHKEDRKDLSKIPEDLNNNVPELFPVTAKAILATKKDPLAPKTDRAMAIHLRLNYSSSAPKAR